MTLAAKHKHDLCLMGKQVSRNHYARQILLSRVSDDVLSEDGSHPSRPGQWRICHALARDRTRGGLMLGQHLFFS